VLRYSTNLSWEHFSIKSERGPHFLLGW
jgi:hypothetical protein